MNQHLFVENIFGFQFWNTFSWNISSLTPFIFKTFHNFFVEKKKKVLPVLLNKSKCAINLIFFFSPCQFSHSVLSNCLWLLALQQARLPCPFPMPGACSNSCSLGRWCHPTISSSVILFSSCLNSFPASVSFPMTQLFTSDGQSIGVSASTSVLPMNIQDWYTSYMHIHDSSYMYIRLFGVYQVSLMLLIF